MFLCATIITISLIEGFFGHQGVIVNHKLTREVLIQQEKLDTATIELHNLEYRLAHIWDTDSLLDSARAMGYAKQGESIYYFIDSDGQPVGDSVQGGEVFTRTVDTKPVQFQGVSPLFSVLVGIIVALCLVIALRLGQKKRHNNQEFPWR